MSELAQFHQGQLKVFEVMTQQPAMVPVGTLLADVAELLVANRYRHVFVNEPGDGIVGVVTSNDLLRHMSEWQDDETALWKSKPVEAVMVTTFLSSSPDASADDVAPMIANGSIDCVPVLEGEKLVGVLTPDDLLLSWNRLDPVLKQAYRDSLTDLLNRATFNRRLAEEWNRSKRQSTSLGLILIDVDHFKTINDTCGHPAGDAVLQMIGSCLRRHLRTYDVVARFAGDEFVALCCDCSPGDIDVPIHRLQSAVRKLSVPSAAGRRSVTLSVGAAVIAGNFGRFDSDELIAAADKCLYRSKREGRDRVYRVVLGKQGETADEVATAAL